MTEEQITKLTEQGFKRWTKGGYDRLYVSAGVLGLECEYYKTGNIKNAYFRGERVSNCEGRRMKAANTYVNVKDGKVHSNNDTLKQAAEEIVSAI